MFISLLIALTSLVGEPPAAPAEPWPVLCLKARDVAVNPADGAAQEVPKVNTIETSPDGRTRAYIGSAANAPADAPFELFAVRAGDQPGDPRQLTRGTHNLRFFGWMPDGNRVVFAAGEAEHTRLLTVSTDPTTPGHVASGPTPLTADIPELGSVAIGANGAVAYYQINRHRGKERVGDVLLTRGSKSTTVLKDVDVRSLAISPDGSRLAVGQIGSIVFIDMAEPNRTVREIKFPDIDEKLYAHLAGAMAWRPDGRELAAKITFAGGRFMVDPKAEPQPMAGDREVFLIPLEGKPRSVTYTAAADGHVHALRWTARPMSDMPPIAPAPAPAPQRRTLTK
ncbi:MAG: hypothetical protein ACREJO_11155 [Phycisphaerales bacterium]